MITLKEAHPSLKTILDIGEQQIVKRLVKQKKTAEQEALNKRKAKAHSRRRSEEAKKPGNQLYTAYISYLRTKACYKARQGYAMVFLNKQEMEKVRKQMKAIEKAITAQHQLNVEKIWKFAVKNMSPLGGMEAAFGGLSQYLATEAGKNFNETRGICLLWRLPLANLANKWVSGGSKGGAIKKDF